MSTGLIIAIIVVAIVLLIGLWFAVTRMGRRRRELQRERQLQERRQAAAAEHVREAEARTRQADVAERRARIAEAEAQRERAEANLHRERAEMHEQGMADHEFAEAGERTDGGAGAGETRGRAVADEAAGRDGVAHQPADAPTSNGAQDVPASRRA
jgi:FtsZ-interacting cell division protein ZipA